MVRVGIDMTWMHHIRRDYESARKSAEIAPEHGDGVPRRLGGRELSIHRALALAHLATTEGEIRTALATATEYLGYWRSAGAETMVSYFLGEMADVHRLSGDPEAAVRTVTEAIELGETNGEHFHDAELHRIRGQARLQCGAGERAHGEDDLRRAVAIAREQAAVSFEIRSIVCLLTLVPELVDRQSWLDQLEAAAWPPPEQRGRR